MVVPEMEGQMGDGLEGEIGTLDTNTIIYIYILIMPRSSIQLTYPLLEVYFLLENEP